MAQEKLFYEDEFEALAMTISNSDKSFKEVANHMFPNLKPDAAYAKLKAWLSPTGDGHPSLGHVIAICRFCGRFDALFFACDELHHERPPRIEPEDEVARLQREYVEATKALVKMATRIEQIQAGPALKVAR